MEQIEAKAGKPSWVTGLKHLGHHPQPFKVHEREAGLEEHPGPDPAF